jgi:predicted RNA-binding Zn-ribbon protein involved in translation (DUF1610 family)
MNDKNLSNSDSSISDSTIDYTANEANHTNVNEPVNAMPGEREYDTTNDSIEQPVNDAIEHTANESVDDADDYVVDTVEDQMDQTIVTTCPSCGGNMAFDPESGELKCAYCGTTKAIETNTTEIIENCFKTALAEGVRTWNDDDIRTFSCKNCGAEIVVSPDAQAQFCNYCGSSHIVEQASEQTIPPHYLVPFSITSKSAGERFHTWISKRWLAPKDLKETYRNDRLLGTYVPHWTYDTNIYAFYTALRGDYYYVTRTRTVNGKTETYQERHTRWTPVRGDYSHFFDDVLVRASNKVDDKLIREVQPFHLDALTEYQPAFLSGFFAERYSVSLEDGWQEAVQIIDTDIEQAVIRKIGGDTVSSLNIQTQYNDVMFKHILLPVWLSSFRYKEKLYHFMINGQTGEVQGQYPKSALKIALLVLLGIAVIAGIYFVIATQS